jgi:hypothetical protein
MDKHVGVYIEDDRKYVLLRTENKSRGSNITVYHLVDQTLNHVPHDDPRWPKIFFGFMSCGCRLEASDITPGMKEALGLSGGAQVSIAAGFTAGNGVMMHGGHDTSGMGSKMSDPAAGFTAGNGVMMHGGHDTSGMYNRMDTQMSGNNMFMDMA